MLLSFLSAGQRILFANLIGAEKHLEKLAGACTDVRCHPREIHSTPLELKDKKLKIIKKSAKNKREPVESPIKSDHIITQKMHCITYTHSTYYRPFPYTSTATILHRKKKKKVTSYHKYLDEACAPVKVDVEILHGTILWKLVHDVILLGFLMHVADEQNPPLHTPLGASRWPCVHGLEHSPTTLVPYPLFGGRAGVKWTYDSIFKLMGYLLYPQNDQN